MDGLRTEVRGQQQQSNDPRNNQHIPQYANYWAPLTRKRHIPPHSAQPQHTNDWAPRTRKRHQQEHRPQRPTERSDPTQHAKGRTGDCPGPRKEAATRRHVTQGVVWPGGGGVRQIIPPPRPPWRSTSRVCTAPICPCARRSCWCSAPLHSQVHRVQSRAASPSAGRHRPPRSGHREQGMPPPLRCTPVGPPGAERALSAAAAPHRRAPVLRDLCCTMCRLLCDDLLSTGSRSLHGAMGSGGYLPLSTAQAPFERGVGDRSLVPRVRGTALATAP